MENGCWEVIYNIINKSRMFVRLNNKSGMFVIIPKCLSESAHKRPLSQAQSHSRQIQQKVRHEGNPTHASNSNEIRCGIHKEDGHYIVDCTKEQQFDNQRGQQSIIGVEEPEMKNGDMQQVKVCYDFKQLQNCQQSKSKNSSFRGPMSL